MHCYKSRVGITFVCFILSHVTVMFVNPFGFPHCTLHVYGTAEHFYGRCRSAEAVF